MEEWKDILNYEGYYKVSNLGRVMSLERMLIRRDGKRQPVSEKIMVGSMRKGYKAVLLKKQDKGKMVSIHKLVAISFIDSEYISKDLVVDHIDNNPLNNRLDNLQIISVRENTSKDRWRGNPKSKFVGVTKNGKGWISRVTINKKRKYLGYFTEEEEANKARLIELSKL